MVIQLTRRRLTCPESNFELCEFRTKSLLPRTRPLPNRSSKDHRFLKAANPLQDILIETKKQACESYTGNFEQACSSIQQREQTMLPSDL